MTTEQKVALTEAQVAEIEYKANNLVVELNPDQLAVARELGFDIERLNVMARNSFNSALKGALEQVISRTIKAKYHAQNKGRVALADECEVEIQRGYKLKNKIS